MKFTWSHYLFLIKIKEQEARKFYEIEAIQGNWKLEDLKRQFNSGLYQRITLSKSTKKNIELAEIGNDIISPKDAILIHSLTGNLSYKVFNWDSQSS